MIAPVAELLEVCDECSQPDWDAYDAFPVTLATQRNGVRFLLALPQGTPAPSVGANPHGHISFEWHRAPRRTLSVSITADSQIHYAALLGDGRASGTEPFAAEVPGVVLDLIRDVMGASA